MEKEYRYEDFTNVPETERISARKRLDTIHSLLKDSNLLNQVMSPYSSYDDHLRRLAKKIKDSKNYFLRSYIEELLKKPEIAIEYYENAELLPNWFQKVLYDFVISTFGKIKLHDD